MPAENNKSAKTIPIQKKQILSNPSFQAVHRVINSKYMNLRIIAVDEIPNVTENIISRDFIQFISANTTMINAAIEQIEPTKFRTSRDLDFCIAELGSVEGSLASSRRGGLFIDFRGHEATWLCIPWGMARTFPGA